MQRGRVDRVAVQHCRVVVRKLSGENRREGSMRDVMALCSYGIAPSEILFSEGRMRRKLTICSQ
jgi:hypothetical protein